jgi:hypothetical protein
MGEEEQGKGGDVVKEGEMGRLTRGLGRGRGEEGEGLQDA